MLVVSRELRRRPSLVRGRMPRERSPLRREPRPSVWRAVAAGPFAGLSEERVVADADPIYEWRPGSYRVGTRVDWEAITLVCCKAHTTYSGAEHPWQVGGMKLEAQACLWAPDGDVEAARLKTLVIDRREEFTERLRAVALLAAGVAKAA